jgi:LuxR family maltose regulon positive regulatory protein
MRSADGVRTRVVPRPALFERLATAGRVCVVTAPAGSGKTVLVLSWIDEAGVNDRAAVVTASSADADPLRFWLAVLDALRGTSPGATLVRSLTPAPDLNGWRVVERLLADLAALTEPAWLVVDDVHELTSEARRQLELLVMRAPSALRIVLITRQDGSLGLHRLRLDAELTEIRADDLRLTRDEAAELLDRSGAALPDPALVELWSRTEGWAAGLRLAALSLAGHPDPQRFVAEFSGSERTVAEYLLAEVLQRQPGPVRDLLVRTSVLERVNGELADVLSGSHGGERILQDLERANAFVVSVDATRSWFRYHRLFADLLRLELRRQAPGEVRVLHRTAARWLAGHGHPVEAIGHAQAAQDWQLAAGLLAEHWPTLLLDGRAATVRDLLTAFPDDVVAAEGELAAVFAVDELAHGSVPMAQRYLALAERTPVEAFRGGSGRLLLETVRLMLARRRGDLGAAAEHVRQLENIADSPHGRPPGRADELRALALVSLDSTDYWTGRFSDAQRHLEATRALAGRVRRPYLELSSLAYQAANEFFLSFDLADRHGRQAVALAERHGWTEEPAVGAAYMTLGAVHAWQGRLAEAEPWVQRAEATIRATAQPLAGMGICHVRATLEMARGHFNEALAAFERADRLAELLAASNTAPNPMATAMRGFWLQTLVHAGETARAANALARLGPRDRERGEMRIAFGLLRLAEGDPEAATTAVAPVIDGTAALVWRPWLAQAYLLEAIARDTLGKPAAAEHALERALDLAEPDGVRLWFLLHPTPDLLARHTGHRTRHAALVTQIQGLLAGAGPGRTSPRPLLEPLSQSEVRVLRYLPTNLSGPEIAAELSVTANTVKTHLRNLYRKLDAHRRSDAVRHAQALGLLAPSWRPPQRG